MHTDFHGRVRVGLLAALCLLMACANGHTPAPLPTNAEADAPPAPPAASPSTVEAAPSASADGDAPARTKADFAKLIVPVPSGWKLEHSAGYWIYERPLAHDRTALVRLQVYAWDVPTPEALAKGANEAIDPGWKFEVTEVRELDDGGYALLADVYLQTDAGPTDGMFPGKKRELVVFRHIDGLRVKCECDHAGSDRVDADEGLAPGALREELLRPCLEAHF